MVSRTERSQNFIVDVSVVDKLLRAAEVNADDLVVEIGPGEGVITGPLAQRAGRVVAVERDPRLAEKLRQRFADEDHVKVEQADILRYPLPREAYKAVGNIPFDQTAAIVNELLRSRQNPPVLAGLIMQAEAAGKFSGRPKPTLAAVLLAQEYEVEQVERVGRRSFRPMPKVDAAIVRFSQRDEPLVAEPDQREFEDLVTWGYVHGQKGRPAMEALKAVFSPRQRAIMERNIPGLRGARVTDLKPQQWVKIFKAFKQYVPEERRSVVQGAREKLRREQVRLPKTHRTRKY